MEKEVVDYDFQSQLLETRKEKIGKGGLLKMFDETSFLKNKPLWGRELFKKISSFCLNEIKAGVVIAYLETYTKYSFNNLMFCKMKSTAESLKIYLKLRYSELEEPPKWVRDYSKISHQTWTEIAIREEDLIEETILLDMTYNLIKKSFNRVIRNPRVSKVSVVGQVKVLPNFVTPTLTKFSVEIGTDGFCQLKVDIHKSQLSKTIDKLLG